MCRLILALLLWPAIAGAATQYVCSAAQGAADGSSPENCIAAGGTTFSNVSESAGDTVVVCGDTGAIRGTLTVTSTNDVTVDLTCTGGTPGLITGTDIVSSFSGPDASGEYTSTDTFPTPHFVLVDGVAWREGIKGALADDEWAFNSSSGGTQAIVLGSNPAGRTVEVARRTHAIEYVTSTGGAVVGGHIYGTRTDGNATGVGAINFNAASGAVTDTTFYAVRKAVDYAGASSGAVIGTSIELCGDGLDANQNTDRPTEVSFVDNLIEDCGYGDWWDNTLTSHSVSVDGEGLACTNCGSGLYILGNRVYRSHKAISTRVNSTVTDHWFARNYIEDTNDEGIDPGCTNTSGVPQVFVIGNIIKRAGSGDGYLTSSYGMVPGSGACGNGGEWTLAQNTIVDSAGGWIAGAAAAQTGVIRLFNNLVVNVNKTGISGTHYYANWNSVNASHSMTLVTDNNRYYQTDGVGFFRWIAGASARAYSSFNSYLTDSGQEASSSLGDPALVGGLAPSAVADYLPTLDSALVNAGACYRTVGCAHADYRGQQRGSDPDIGALELGQGDPAVRVVALARATATARSAAAVRAARQ